MSALGVTPLFVGRENELGRLTSALTRVTVAWLYGVGGVGKTTLARVFAGRAPGPVVFCDAGSAPLDALVDDARRELGPRSRPEPRDTEQRLGDLIARLNAQRATWVVDDAHELGDGAAARLVEVLASRLRQGRAIFTSRHRLAVGARAPDRLELAIEGLPAEASRELWQSLDELYGPRVGFDQAQAKCAGNPLLLRRAHAGPLDDEDLLGGELAELSGDARLLALVLAVSDRALGAAALEELLPEGRLRPVLRTLVTSLVAEVEATGETRIHDMFREALLARASAEEQRAARAELVRVLPSAGLDPKSLVRELSRQLVALERFEDLDQMLRSRAPEVIRAGATGELLRCMDLVPPERRSLALRIERARCIGRHYDLQRAYEELGALHRELSSTPPELAYALAEAAYDQCLPNETEALLFPLLEQPSTSPEQRARAVVRLAAALTLQGRGEAGRALLSRAAETETDPDTRARLALQEAMTYNAEENWEKAASSLGRARALLEDAQLDENAIYVPLTFAVIYSRAGRMEESNALLARLNLELEPEDDSARIFMLASKASLLFDRGQRVESLALRSEAARLNEPLGGVHYALTGALWHSRTLFALGRRREARLVLAPALARARALGCQALAERLERAPSYDPAAQLEADLPTPPRDKTGDFVRARAIAALRFAAQGDAPSAEVALSDVERSAHGQSFGLDLAITGLARAFGARRSGKSGEARRLIEQARREAALAGADPEVLASLEEWARRRAGVVSEPPPAARAPSAVLDVNGHELRWPGGRASLKSRPVLRRLLYTLAARAGSVVSKDELTRAMWGSDYDPLRHDTPLWQNVRRLRQLVAPAGLGLEVDEDGYRLVASEGLIVDGAD
ncbi:MAG: winged helix-turn-helix domain-containing protein [Myxococcales bacterium]|nr:winged helix-turn-helix domain-containing protein [Myxococcales bacterium]